MGYFNTLVRAICFLHRSSSTFSYSDTVVQEDWNKVLLKIATGLAWLPYITLSEENAAQEYRNDIMDKMHYALRGLAKEFGEGVLSEEMIEQLLQSKINISKERQLAETFQIDWFNGNEKNGHQPYRSGCCQFISV